MTTLSRRIIRVFLFLSVFICTTFFAGIISVRAAYADEVWGSHAYCWANQTIFDLIYKTYGGTEWYPVTVMIGVDGRGKDNLQALFENAKNAGKVTPGGKGIIPILRLTSQGGATSWSKISPDAAAAMLNSVNPASYGIPTPVYVSFGNETHMSNEWGGESDPSSEYGDSFRTFVAAMSGNGNYVVGHAAVNLSFPPCETDEGCSDGKDDGDKAERFYSSVAGKGAGNFSGSGVLFSNPYELGNVPFPDDPGIPGTAYRANTTLNIPEHIDIDRHYNGQQGGSNSTNIWMEFGKHPGLAISERQVFLEDAYSNFRDGNYKGLGPKFITPMLMDEVGKYIVIFKKNQGVSYIPCGGVSCGDEICAGGSARNNPSTTPPVLSGSLDDSGDQYSSEQGCVPGQYELTIKGTIKSKGEYIYGGIDPVTGKGRYTPYTYGTQTDAPIVNNVPVKGAVIQVHNSYRDSSQDTRSGLEQTIMHDYNSGLLDGMIRQSYSHVKTGSDGKFVITARSSCDDVYRSNWKGAGYEQFFTVSCPDKPAGATSAGLYAKETFGMILNLKQGEDGSIINYPDIVVDCGVDPESTYGSFPVNNNLKPSRINRDVYMSCSGVRTLAGDTSKGAVNYNYNWNQGVKFDDSFYADDKPWEWSIEYLKNWALNEIGITQPFGANGEETEVRGQIAGQRLSVDQISTLPAFYTGIKGGVIDYTRYYRNSEDVPPGVDTYNGHEEKPKIYTCEELRMCNTSVNFKAGYRNENTQTCGGTAFNLASPYAGVVKTADGKVDMVLSEYVGRFLDMDKKREICTLPGGDKLLIEDIMPPSGYCGDINGNSNLDANELPCPNSWTCGDQNENGLQVSEGEVDCSSIVMQNGINWRYKLDVRYFPYFALFSPTTFPEGDSETRRYSTRSDAYASMCPRGLNPGENYNPEEGPEGISKPESSGCAEYGPGSDTFYTHEEVKYPGYKDNQISYAISQNLSSPKLKSYPLPFQAIGSPQFSSSKDSTAVVEEIIDGMKSTISATSYANFFRIGVPVDLCSCSLVEEVGASGFGKCNKVGGDDGGAPDPVEPSNLMSIGRDEGGNPGGHPERENEIYNPPVGPNAKNKRTSQVAGGADWSWRSLYPGSVWSDGSNEKFVNETNDLHYQQPITSALGRLLETIREYVDCNRIGEKHEPIYSESVKNEIIGYKDSRNIGCDRIIKHMANNKNLTAWGMPSFDSAPLVFPESFFPPANSQMVHEDIEATTQENSYLTKAQHTPEATDRFDMPGNQGSGYVIPRGADYVSWHNTLSSLVSQPSFGGDINQCTTVPGWNVAEYPGRGLFGVDCDDNLSECVAVGSTNNESWASGPRLLLKSQDAGVNWAQDTNITGGNAASWLHGVGLSPQSGTKVAAGQLGWVYVQKSGSPWRSIKMSRTGFASLDNGTDYKGYLYDIAGGPGGYLATGGGHVFFSRYGVSDWSLLAEHDGLGKVGCEGPDYAGPDTPGDAGYEDRYKCVYPPADTNAPMNCDSNFGDNTLPNCCCDSDTDPRTPACPDGASHSNNLRSCWTWGDSSIWGVDCNSAGDCLIAGQYTPKVWYAAKDRLGDVSAWRDSKKVLGASCTDCSAMGVSFAGDDKAFVVEGKKGKKIGDAGSDSEKGSATILVNSRQGGNWGVWTEVGGIGNINTDLRSVDCFDAGNCAAVGTNGVILVTEDGNTWKEKWADDPKISEAKEQGVRFWDVAYKNKDTIIAVGFKPSSPHADAVSGVIYTLGERVECTEPDDGGEGDGGDGSGDGGDSGFSGPGVPGADCNSSCSTCTPLTISATCSGGTVTNTTQDVWGDVSIEFKKCADPSRPNYCEGNSVGFNGKANLGKDGSLSTKAGVGVGRWAVKVSSNPQNCQGPANPSVIINCL